jgi:hypothetical protein
MPSIFSRFKRKSKSHKSESVTSSAPSSPARSERTVPRHESTQVSPSPKERVLPVIDTPTQLEPHHEQHYPSSSGVAAPATDVTSDMRDMTLDPPPQIPPLHLSDSLTTTFESDAKPTLAQSSRDEPALDVQRDALVKEVAGAAKARKTELSAEGKAAFDAAGIAVTSGSLEVETRYMKPVVQVSYTQTQLRQETIIIREHTETTTIIDQHIHRHHI